MKLARRLWRAPTSLTGPIPGALVELLREADENGEVKLKDLNSGRHFHEKAEKFERNYESMSHLLNIPYRRWRHRLAKYEITVLGVYQHGDQDHATVRVNRGRRRPNPTSWPILTFLGAFEPLGEPMKLPTCWDRISETPVASSLESPDGGCGGTDDPDPHQGQS